MKIIRKTSTFTQQKTQQRNSQLKVLKEALQAGLDSGVSNKNVLDVMQKVETKLATTSRFS